LRDGSTRGTRRNLITLPLPFLVCLRYRQLRQTAADATGGKGCIGSDQIGAARFQSLLFGDLGQVGRPRGLDACRLSRLPEGIVLGIAAEVASYRREDIVDPGVGPFPCQSLADVILHRVERFELSRLFGFLLFFLLFGSRLVGRSRRSGRSSLRFWAFRRWV
jgi:hypothetical protein